MRVRLDLQKFVVPWDNNPFDSIPYCWGAWKLVRRDIARTRLPNPRPFDPFINDVKGDKPWSRQDHLRRIRFLVDNPTPDPVEIAIYESHVSLIDGFHRVAAALFRGDEWILGEIEPEGDAFTAADLLALAQVAWQPPED